MILKNGIFFYLIIYSLNFIFYNTSPILFPFKKIASPYLKGYRSDKNIVNNNNEEAYNNTQFFNQHYVFKFLTMIEIGSPPQKVISQIEIFKDSLLIKDFSDVNIQIFNQKDYTEYQTKESYTFKNISETKKYNNVEIIKYLGEDEIYFFTDINDIKENKYSNFHNFKFELGNFIINASNYYSLSIGLNYDIGNSITNFMRQLHSRKIISSFLISFEYNIDDITKEYDGLLMIGKYPHQLMPDKYKEEDFISFYSNQPNTMFITNFFIHFDEMSSIDKNNIKNVFENKKAVLRLNSDLIIGTGEYLDYIEKTYFEKYYKLKICKQYKTNTQFLTDFIIISCDVNNNLNLEEFPTIKFYMKQENLSFELTYKDLFMKINNKYYFCISFETKNLVWHIGTPLFNKYTFVYNGEAKTVGFYKKKIIKNAQIIENNNNNKDWKLEINIGKIIIILVLLIIFIFLIAFISYCYGKKIHFIRKRHANELVDDNFEYKPNMKYQKFGKDVNEKNIKGEEKHLELVEKTEDMI